jgi:cell pole-organizing protein PopZ
MGDVSNEPSMEDILSSIKRIIAEEGDAAAANRPRRPARAAAPAAVSADDDEILELNEPAPSEAIRPEPRRAPQPIQRETPRVDLRDVAPEAVPQPAPADSILSQTTAEATRGPLEALSRMVVKPEAAPAALPVGETSLEGMVREMIRPMLRDWLDANLPRMVEEMVQREISRIAAGRD